ncbi:MAG: NAD-dependent epimerase/dehydratase family protein, partial [Actinomycetota bacterium]
GERPTIFGDGSKTRDYVFVEDVVRANLLAMEKAPPGACYNIGTGQPTTASGSLTWSGQPWGRTWHRFTAASGQGRWTTSISTAAGPNATWGGAPRFLWRTEFGAPWPSILMEDDSPSL